jgi:hypothetical protein
LPEEVFDPIVGALSLARSSQIDGSDYDRRTIPVGAGGRRVLVTVDGVVGIVSIGFSSVAIISTVLFFTVVCDERDGGDDEAADVRHRSVERVGNARRIHRLKLDEGRRETSCLEMTVLSCGNRRGNATNDRVPSDVVAPSIGAEEGAADEVKSFRVTQSVVNPIVTIQFFLFVIGVVIGVVIGGGFHGNIGRGAEVK